MSRTKWTIDSIDQITFQDENDFAKSACQRNPGAPTLNEVDALQPLLEASKQNIDLQTSKWRKWHNWRKSFVNETCLQTKARAGEWQCSNISSNDSIQRISIWNHFTPQELNIRNWRNTTDAIDTIDWLTNWGEDVGMFLWDITSATGNMHCHVTWGCILTWIYVHTSWAYANTGTRHAK